MIWCDVIDSGQVHPNFSNTMFGGVWIWQYRLPSWLQVPKNLFVLTLFLVQKAKIKNHGVQHEIDKVWLSTRKQLDGEAPNKPNYPIQTSWRVKPVKLPSIIPNCQKPPPSDKTTKPWDKMMQHVTNCLNLSKEIHYCKTVSDWKTPNKCAKEGILLSPLTFHFPPSMPWRQAQCPQRQYGDAYINGQTAPKPGNGKEKSEKGCNLQNIPLNLGEPLHETWFFEWNTGISFTKLILGVMRSYVGTVGLVYI